MVDDAVLEYIYLKNKKLKQKFRSIILGNQSARLSDFTKEMYSNYYSCLASDGILDPNTYVNRPI